MFETADAVGGSCVGVGGNLQDRRRGRSGFNHLDRSPDRESGSRMTADRSAI
jgi:hypothetical protein